jgi:hypothetical protein
LEFIWDLEFVIFDFERYALWTMRYANPADDIDLRVVP